MSWSTGEVGGASGVTMAERTREGGCRRSGGGFSIPLGNDEPLLAARLTQQLAIASGHQSQTALHETNGPIAQIVGFPGPFGDVLGAKQALGERAIAIAFDAAIERAHCQGQSLSTLWGQFIKGGTGGAPVERPPESARGMESRNHCRAATRLRNARLRHAALSATAIPDVPDPQENVPAIGGLPDFAG
jgi:hypothetical protein